MRRIVSIEHIEKKPGYSRTYALLDDGEIACGFGEEFKPGDLVMVFFDHKWNTIKMAKPKPKLDKN